MLDINRIIDVLWEPFLKDISSGEPIYFSFHGEFLSDLFSKKGIEHEDPVALIDEAANTFLIVIDNNVIISPKAFNKNSSGFSAAIILACQQILAAEEMTRDNSGFSEHAYFPRLRRKISPDIAELSLNPFPFGEFKRIWRTLATEVSQVKGSSKDSVTFRFDREYGVNKARSFPLSQALLSREDLITLTAKIGREKILRTKIHDIWPLLRDQKLALHSRARSIISLPFLRDKIVEQVYSFAKKTSSIPVSELQELPKNDNDYELRIFKDSIDWLTDEHALYMLEKKTNSIVDDANLIHKVLLQALDNRGYLIFPLGIFGDFWARSNARSEIIAGETFLILGKKSGVDRATQLINSLIKGKISYSEPLKLRGLREISICEVQLPADFFGSLSVQAGKILPLRNGELKHGNDWIGGVCLDRRTNKFLRGHLPTAIRVDGIEITLDRLVSVNGKYTTYSVFNTSLINLNSDTQFELGLEDAGNFKICVGVCYEESPNYIGLRFSENNLLDCSLTSIDINEQALIGFRTNKIVEFDHLSPIECGLLLSELLKNNGLPLETEQKEHFKTLVEQSKIPNATRVVLKHLLNQNTLDE